MHLFQAIVVLSLLAAGAMAGCRADENVCKSGVLSIKKARASGWECHIADDQPCVTTCDVTGLRGVEWAHQPYLVLCSLHVCMVNYFLLF